MYNNRVAAHAQTVSNVKSKMIIMYHRDLCRTIKKVAAHVLLVMLLLMWIELKLCGAPVRGS